jgi:hypothetical protein
VNVRRIQGREILLDNTEKQKDEKKHGAFLARRKNIAPMEIRRNDLVTIKTAT